MKWIAVTWCVLMALCTVACGQQEPQDQTGDAATPAPLQSADLAAQWVIGTYVYYADAASFVDCVSGQRYPVAAERDNLALERAYLAARPEPMVPVLVELQGYLALRPKMEGDGDEVVLIPEKFLRIAGGRECLDNMPLEYTTWDLLSVEGETTLIPDNAGHGPHLRLLADQQRAVGSDGCNRFFGSYDSARSVFTLGQLGSTQMYCEDTMETAEKFMRALSLTRTYRIEGVTLELLDEDRQPLAVLSARPLLVSP